MALYPPTSKAVNAKPPTIGPHSISYDSVKVERISHDVSSSSVSDFFGSCYNSPEQAE